MYRNEPIHRIKKTALVVIAACYFFINCGGGSRAIVWTERPEFAIYAEAYNASQGRYAVEVRFVDDAAGRLTGTRDVPDIVIGTYLNSPSCASSFSNIEYLFSKNFIDKDAFYPELLRLGLSDKGQYLIPVSFNIPTIFFKNDTAGSITNYLCIDLDELKTLGAEYNRNENGDWQQKGFSPLWGAEDDFIFTTARLFNANFIEEKQRAGQKETVLNWNSAHLNDAVHYLNDWISINGGFQPEEDFIYKYFFNPAPKLIIEGRICFAYEESDDYFNMPENTSNAELDFRWLSRNGELPVSEDVPFFGIHKKSKAKKAAADFAAWFFKAETQEQLLRLARENHLNENVFGIAGGFSAMRTVTESIFPKYYSALLGHIPPSELLSVSAALPSSWREIKEHVIIPSMLDDIRASTGTRRTLQERLADWQKLKRGTFR
jgi:ABC-type glycerol-3-phosphate transport system substrate-binding protein